MGASASSNAKSFESTSLPRGFDPAVAGSVPRGGTAIQLKEVWRMSKEECDDFLKRLPEDLRRTTVVAGSKTKPYKIYIPVSRTTRGSMWIVRKFSAGKGDLPLETLLKHLSKLVPAAFRYHYAHGAPADDERAEAGKQAYISLANLERLLVRNRSVYVDWARD